MGTWLKLESPFTRKLCRPSEIMHTSSRNPKPLQLTGSPNVVRSVPLGLCFFFHAMLCLHVCRGFPYPEDTSMQPNPSPSSGHTGGVEARSLPYLEVAVMSVLYCFSFGTADNIFVLTSSVVSAVMCCLAFSASRHWSPVGFCVSVGGTRCAWWPDAGLAGMLVWRSHLVDRESRRSALRAGFCAPRRESWSAWWPCRVSEGVFCMEFTSS